VAETWLHEAREAELFSCYVRCFVGPLALARPVAAISAVM
jgi:hypothetical protein